MTPDCMRNIMIYGGGPGAGPPVRLEAKVSHAGGQPGLYDRILVKPLDLGLQGAS